MFNFALGCLLTYFFQMCSACQVIQTALSDEFVFSIYRFITLCATGSFSPQEPLDLLHLGKCWDLVLIPEKRREEEPHLWVTSSWGLPGFNSLARCSGLDGPCPHYLTACLTSADLWAPSFGPGLMGGINLLLPRESLLNTSPAFWIGNNSLNQD